MTHVAVEQFEGPLGILLDLVERGRLEVTAISVAEITATYIERVKQLEDRTPEELSEFLQLGARLLYIKSLALLPQESAREQGEEIRQLNLELEDYRRMQLAARELARRTASRTYTRTITERLRPDELPLPDLKLTQLADAFAQALKRVEPAKEMGVIRRHTSIEPVIAKIKSRLRNGQFELQLLLDECRDRVEVIVSFLALLEIVRSGSARVAQADQFAPIIVEATGV